MQTRKCNSSVIRQKGESQNRCFIKESTPKFPKNENFLPPHTHTSRKENLPKSKMNAGRPLHFLLLHEKNTNSFFSSQKHSSEGVLQKRCS